MQAAGDAVRRILVGFTKLAAGMQRGEDDLHGRHFFLGMDIHRNAASIVADFRRAVLVEHHFDRLGKSRQAFVGRIVDDLDQRVIRIRRIGVHSGAVQDRGEVLEDLDILGGISVGFFGHGFLQQIAATRCWIRKLFCFKPCDRRATGPSAGAARILSCAPISRPLSHGCAEPVWASRASLATPGSAGIHRAENRATA